MTENNIKLLLDYEENDLYIMNENDHLIPIPKNNKFINDQNSLIFILDSNIRSRWVSFKIFDINISAFYKRILEDSEIVYYKKTQPKKTQTKWEFTEKDIIEKKEDGKWGPI